MGAEASGHPFLDRAKASNSIGLGDLITLIKKNKKSLPSAEISNQI